MNWVCPSCDRIIVGSNFCPICEVYSTTPSSSTVTIEEITDESPGIDLKRKRDRSPSPSGRDKARLLDEDRSRLHLSTSASASKTSYALAHTLGRCAFDPHGGDGAYSSWMHNYFSEHQDLRGCVHVDRLAYTGPVGNIKDGQLTRRFNPVLLREMERFLRDERLNQTTTIILNWHIRCTGTPNGYTGRGANPKLMSDLKKMAKAAGKNLVVIYTVHEYTQLSGKLPDHNAIVALNPDVYRSLGTDFDFNQISSVCSRVPGLMTSLHTSSVDLILQLMGTPDHGPVAHNLISGCLLQQLRLLNGYSNNSDLRATPGIILFGMITQRHGTTVDNVRSLCQALDTAGFPATFKVIVVGKPQEDKLVENLNLLAHTTPRLICHGLLDSFNDLVGCKYAISFDPLGFRNNASAMVNVTRAGHLLFSRASGESDAALIQRAGRLIFLCERNPSFYAEMLAAQQPRFRSTAPLRVGHDLDLFFRERAGTASSSDSP